MCPSDFDIVVQINEHAYQIAIYDSLPAGPKAIVYGTRCDRLWYLVVVVVIVVVDLWGWAVLVGVVLVGTLVLDIVLIVHIPGALCCVFASLIPVVLVHAMRFCKFVHFSAHETSQEFLRKLVVDSLAYEWSVTGIARCVDDE